MTLLGFWACCLGNPLGVPLSPRKVYTIVTHFLWDTLSVFLWEFRTGYLHISLGVPLSPRKVYRILASFLSDTVLVFLLGFRTRSLDIPLGNFLGVPLSPQKEYTVVTCDLAFGLYASFENLE